MFTTLVVSAALLQAAVAHFSVEYPQWRADSFEEPGDQWQWPCANINSTDDTPRTPWPITGGSVNLTVHHEWAPTYINLGLGSEVAAFRTPLIPLFNQTGNGTFCIREAGRAALAALNITEGQDATLQFVQISTNGNALYNCADIRFTADAQLLAEDQCANSTDVGGVALVNAGSETASGSEGGASGTPSGSAAAGGAVVPSALLAVAALAAVVGLA